MRRSLVLAARIGLTAGCAGLIAGCVRPPVPLSGSFAPMTVRDSQIQEAFGSEVRWGGRLARVDLRDDETCLEIVSLPLDRRARPTRSDVSDGRFLACSPGFYDPAIYTPRREVTVVGTVVDLERGTVGKRGYTFPKVAAAAIYLWPEPRSRRPVYYGPWIGYWGPYHYYPFYYGPYWYGPYGHYRYGHGYGHYGRYHHGRHRRSGRYGRHGHGRGYGRGGGGRSGGKRRRRN